MKQHLTLPLRLLLLVVLAASSVGAAAAGIADKEKTRGWVDPTRSTEPIPYRVPLAGVNVDLTQYGTEKLALHLQEIEAQGFVWVRQFFLWNEVQPARETFIWAPWDRIVEAVAAHPNLKLVAVLHTSPPWTRPATAPEQVTAPPADLQAFASFVTAFAARYGAVIDDYQIWDEPNLKAAWGDQFPNPAEYAALLEKAYEAIHAGDSSARVIAAALAPTIEQGPQNLSDVRYLQTLYENGAAQFFDAAAAKPYGFSTGPDDRRLSETVLNFSRIILLRELMVRYGDGNKALWSSEFGWNALPDDWTGRPSIWGEVDAATKRHYIRAAYERAAIEWPWIGGLILQSWQPNAPSDDPRWGFALLPHEDAPNALPDDLLGISRFQDVALPGKYPAQNVFASFEGDWTFGELGADIGQDNDGRLRFDFLGEAVALDVRRGGYRGYLYPTIDGGAANALPEAHDGRRYLILNSADNTTHVDTVLVANGLGFETHTLEASAEFGWGQWALAGFRVGVPYPSARSFQAMMGVALVAACLLILAPANRRFLSRFWVRLQQVFGKLKTPWQFVLGLVTSGVLMLGMLTTWGEGYAAFLRKDPPGIVIGLLTSGVLYLSDSMLLTIAAATFLLFIILYRLDIGLWLTILWTPFFLFPVALYHYAFPMAEVCLLLTAGAWTIRAGISFAKRQTQASTGKKAHVRFSAIDWGVVAYLLIGTLSLYWTEYRDVALTEWRTMIIEPAIFYMMLRTIPASEEALKDLVRAFVLAAVAAAGISMIMYFTGQGVALAEQGIQRMAGIYGSPNNLGLFLGRALPFALISLLGSRSPVRRLACLLGIVVILAAVILSQSAGALLLGIPASLLLMLFMWNRRYGVFVSFAGAVATIMGMIPLSQHPRFARLLDFSSGTTFFRLRLWESAARMIIDRPLRGFGLDQFLYQYRSRYIFPDAWQEPNLSHPHNFILDFWTRLGLGGLFTFLWLQYAFWRQGFRNHLLLATSKGGRLWLINLASLAAMVDLLVHGLVDNSVFVRDLSLVFVLLLSLPQNIAALIDEEVN